MISAQERRFCVFARSLKGGGGAERVTVHVARGLAELGYRVDFVMGRVEGNFLDEIPATVNVIDLRVRHPWQALPTLARRTTDLAALSPILFSPGAPRVLGAIPGLAEYLRRNRPVALITALNYPSITALLARDVANTATRVVISVQNHLSQSVAHAQERRTAVVHRLARHFFPRADEIVVPSDGLAVDLSAVTAIPRERITTIPNPVITPEMSQRAAEPLSHPWFAPGGPPVLLGIGKLKPQKDFTTLIQAFALLRARQPARLMILGEGPERGPLERLARELGVAEDVALPGFAANPFAYLARAQVFALSSRWEGFGNVVAEALAMGCPVVSTDCQSGPREILEGGRYGTLVPVGDAEALAEALAATLARPPNREAIRARGSRFSVDRAARAYAEVALGKRDGSAPLPHGAFH